MDGICFEVTSSTPITTTIKPSALLTQKQQQQQQQQQQHQQQKIQAITNEIKFPQSTNHKEKQSQIANVSIL